MLHRQQELLELFSTEGITDEPIPTAITAVNSKGISISYTIL